MRLSIGIASAGRRRILEATLWHLADQTRRPDRLHLCAVGEAPDPDLLAALPYEVESVRSEPGLTRQRNAILDACGGFDAVLFLDDDFLPADDYMERLEEILDVSPDIAMTTGAVLADGIGGAGLSFEEGKAILDAAGPAGSRIREVHNGYGCNMSVRLSAARGLRFDEALPLYGWLEDVDFSRRLAARGHVVRAEGTRGVHLGVKTGRSPGRRLGYSQVANPIRLMRQGTMGPARALAMMARNLGMNALRARRPEPWVDRAGRLRGNAMAFGDLIRGRLDPMRAAEIDG